MASSSSSSPSSSSSSPPSSPLSSEPCNKSFCSNYMLLKHEEAGLLDLVKVLFSSDVGKRKFVESSSDGADASWEHRGIIFLTTLIMKVLQATKNPVASLGSGIENWLNLLSENGGFFKLMLNFFKGKVARPEEGSAGFVSFTGHMDMRKELDTIISGTRPGDKAYYAGLCVMAAKASYENRNYIQTLVNDHWKMEFIDSYDFWDDYQEEANTQAFLMDDAHDTIVVAFRGTETFDNDAWTTDVDISWYEIPGLGRVHGGFMKALGLQKSQGWPRTQDPGKPQTAYYGLRDKLKTLLQENDRAKFVITGHSLGGALAALFPAILALHGEDHLLNRLEGVYTFGQPRVGNETFVEFMKGVMTKYEFQHYRFVYGFDMVPRVPAEDSAFMFKHFGTCIHFNSLYKGKIVEEQPNKNYFNILWLVPKILNACWELVRSFIIPYTRGPEYSETGSIRMLRMIGLLVAGVPAHMPTDYVNSVRIGSAEVFKSNDKALKSQ